MKKWEVKFKSLLNANSILTVNIQADTERKAKLKATKKLNKMAEGNQGHFIELISVKEIK